MGKSTRSTTSTLRTIHPLPTWSIRNRTTFLPAVLDHVFELSILIKQAVTKKPNPRRRIYTRCHRPLYKLAIKSVSTHPSRRPVTPKSAAMSPKLKPLLLPQLVEERRKRESISDPEMDLSSSYCYSQNSSTSEIPSPVTPTFSIRGHLRYPSSASSIDSTFHSSVNDSPSSPAFAGPKSGKRSLPDVQEEPHERDEDFDMFEEANVAYDCLCKL